ncbi:MAG TPA: EAL domain-containing protein [Nocardioides sp.]|nr:EAL domain-containing protein [Nocardioides sp.]
MPGWSSRLLFVLLACTLGVYPLLPSLATRDVLQTLVTAGALTVVWHRLVTTPQLRRRGWATVATAVTVLGASDALAALETHVLDVTGSSRVSPVVALVGYVALGLGVVDWHRHRSTRHRLPGGIEAAIFAVGALAPLAVFLVAPVLEDPDVTLARKAITLTFGVVDLLALALVTRALLSDERRSPSLILHLGAVTSALVGASWAGLTGSGGEPSAVTAVRMLFLLAFILFAAGLAHPSVRGTTTRMTAYDQTPSRRWVWLMGVGQILPLATLALSWLLGLPSRSPIVAGAGIAVALLVAIRMTGFLRRIREQSEQLGQLARSDELTGLHNRRSWNYELRRACTAAESRGERLAVGLIDLDHFKEFNDTRGHLAGDDLLRKAAASWRRMLGSDEVLARYGGEEFAIALPGVGLMEAVARVDALRQAMPEGQTFSAGVAMWSPGMPPEAAMAVADEALYRAKDAGRNRVIAAELPQPEEAETVLLNLEVVLQPIVRADDLVVVGYEALSRFPHTDDVEAAFTHAHEAGYGDRLEAAAVRRATSLGRRPGTLLYVNVSEAAIRSERFWAELPGDLSGVVVELHEGRHGLDDESLADHLERLRRRGAAIGLDDVGNRPSDLPRIVTLRPDVVKIDRALVHGAHLRPGSAEVIRVLTEFARARGATVVVEGVETDAELEVARASGAALVQGNLVGRPGPEHVEVPEQGGPRGPAAVTSRASSEG